MCDVLFVTVDRGSLESDREYWRLRCNVGSGGYRGYFLREPKSTWTRFDQQQQYTEYTVLVTGRMRRTSELRPGTDV